MITSLFIVYLGVVAIIMYAQFNAYRNYIGEAENLCSVKLEAQPDYQKA
jgi:hypothetical protein